MNDRDFKSIVSGALRRAQNDKRQAALYLVLGVWEAMRLGFVFATTLMPRALGEARGRGVLSMKEAMDIKKLFEEAKSELIKGGES